MIKKPQKAPHALVSSAYCPKASCFGQQPLAGRSAALKHQLLTGLALSLALTSASYSAEATPEATTYNTATSPNWQQWQDATTSAEDIVDREVGDSGLLLDAIADEPNDGLQINEENQVSYGSSASWLLRGEPYFIDKISVGPRQVGNASWYGPGFHGRLTASGERFDMHQLTAAHRTLPLPSYIRVTNMGNNRAVIVKVNDRGPYHSKRMLDLSYAAAQALGFHGVAKVSIEPVEQGRTGHLRKGQALGSAEVYRVRLGNFSSANLAHDLESRLLTVIPKGVGIDVVQEREPERAYRVSVGPMLTRQEAELVVRGLRAQRLGLLTAIAVKPAK